MPLTITHTKVAVTPDDPSVEVGTNEWNATHTVVETLPVFEKNSDATAATIAAAVDVIQTLGYTTPGDRGGAYYNRVATQPPHALFIQSADGAFWEYTPGIEGVNGKVAGMVADGTTDNFAAYRRLWYFIKTYGRAVKRTCTMTIASPGVVTLVDHNLRVNEAIAFTTTGSLPTGVTSNQVYYVSTAGMTKDTFQFTLKNAYPPGEGQDGITVGVAASVNTSGSQSGTHSVQICGIDGTKIYIPPGNYNFSSNVNAGGNGTRCRLDAYGVNIINGGGTLNYASYTPPFTIGYSGQDPRWATLTVDAAAGQTTVTVSVTAPTTFADLVPGTWVVIGALDMQNPWHSLQSWPPNLHFFEFVRVLSTNSGAGTVTFYTPLKQGYKTWYPQFWDGGSNAPASGPAILYPTSSDWDQEVEITGLRDNSTGQVTAAGKSVKIKDCHFYGQGPVPSWSKYWEMDNCKVENFGFISQNSGGPEIDKLIDEVNFKNCEFGSWSNQSSSINRLVIENCKIGTMNGTARQTLIRNSEIRSLLIGPLTGMADNLIVENSQIGNLESNLTFSEQAITRQTQGVANYSIVDGVLKRPITYSDGMNGWAIPGAHGVVRDYALTHLSIGSPFQIVDIFKDVSDNFCIETDLTALPVGSSTQSTVTISIASPAVISWAGHGLAANTPIVFNTTGALPTGLLAHQNSPQLYYVSATGLNVNDFQVSATAGGAVINTSGSQSGVHTAIANPLKFSMILCPRVTFRDCTGSVKAVELCEAPPELPCGTFMKQRIQANLGGPGYGNINNTLYLHGKLVYISINVLKAYTGGAGTMNWVLTFNAFNTSLIQANPTFTINTFNVGKRLITPLAATGALGGDTIAAADVWISGSGFSITQSAGAGGEDPGTWPLVELEIQTDLGTYDSGTVSVFGATAQESNAFVWVDTMRSPEA